MAAAIGPNGGTPGAETFGVGAAHYEQLRRWLTGFGSIGVEISASPAANGESAPWTAWASAFKAEPCVVIVRIASQLCAYF